MSKKGGFPVSQLSFHSFPSFLSLLLPNSARLLSWNGMSIISEVHTCRDTKFVYLTFLCIIVTDVPNIIIVCKLLSRLCATAAWSGDNSKAIELTRSTRVVQDAKHFMALRAIEGYRTHLFDSGSTGCQVLKNTYFIKSQMGSQRFYGPLSEEKQSAVRQKNADADSKCSKIPGRE